MAQSLLVSALLAAFSGAAPPAFVLDGQVVDKESGRPIAGAEVALVGRPGGTRTDAEGRFSWAGAPHPPFEVVVVLPSGAYVRPMLVETLAGDSLRLEISPALEESIMVVAGTAPSLETAPADGVTTVPADDLYGRQPAHVAQALENVAGVATISEGQAAVVAVRGLAAGRTLLLIDGGRVTTERRVGPSATYVDPAALEGIEVSRGPGSVAYGSDALGGVIHLRTRRATPGAPFGGRFSGAVGAGTPQQRASLELTRGFARGGVRVQGHYRNFEDWQSPEGEVLNSGAEDRGFLARVDHQLAGGLFSAGWQSDFGRDVERPRNNSDLVRFFYPTEDSHRLTLGWDRGAVAGLSRLGGTLFVGTYSVVTDQDRFATPARARSVERADVSAKDFHLRAYAEKPVGAALLDFGVDLNGRFDLEAHDIGLFYTAAGDLERTTDNLSTEDARRTDAGLYVQGVLPASSTLSLTGGARVDRVGTKNSGGFFGDRSESATAFSGFAAATVGPFSGFSATAQVARGFRDPTLSDRYFRGPTGRGFVTGNPDLEPESSVQFDGAVRYVASRWRAAAYAYHYRIDDLVERYTAETDFFFFRNRGRARIRGVEAEVQATLPWRLGLELSAHRVSGRALDDDAFLDTIPVPTFTARLRRDFERGHGWVRTGLYGRLDEPGPTEQARPGYGLLDAGAAVNVGRGVELGVVGRNLLDRAYLVSPDARATLAPGRTLIGTASLTF
jgi:outer membrane receptor protein involved in Fe transport